MEVIVAGQRIVLLLLGVAALCVQIYAFQDCIRRQPAAFQATGNMTKVIWLVITGVSAAVGFVFFNGSSAVGFLNLVAFVSCMVYLVRVKPAVQGFPRQGGGGGSSAW